MKQWFKMLGRGLGLVLALPSLLVYALLRLIMHADDALALTSERVAKHPGMLGRYTRQSFYRTVLAHVGDDVHFGFMTLLSKAGSRIGDRVYLGRMCTLGLVEIGQGAMIADGVQILSGSHQHGSGRDAEAGQSPREQRLQYKLVRIGKEAWIGANAVVMADVGDYAIVGAGAVVTKPVEAGAVVAGVPAKPIAKASPVPAAGSTSAAPVT